MKTTKLLVLSAIAAIGMTACGTGSDTPTNVDLKTEEGKAALKKSVDQTAKAYSDGTIEALGLNATITNTNFSITGTMEYGEMKINNIDIGLKNCNGTLNAAVKKAGQSLEAAVTATGSGTLSAKLDLVNGEQTTNFNDSLTIADVSAGAYFKNNTAYVDYSSAGIRQLLTDASAIVNAEAKKIVPQMPINIDLNTMLDTATGVTGRKVKIANEGAAPAFPEIKYEYTADTESSLNEVLDTYLLKEDGVRDLFSFTTYSSGKFELGFKLNLEKLTNLITTVETIVGEESEVYNYLELAKTIVPEVVKKIDLDASFTFNNKGFLVEESLTYDISLATKFLESYIPLIPYLVPNLSFLSDVKALDLTINASGSEKVSLTYNEDVKVEFPTDLDSYVAPKAR